MGSKPIHNISNIKNLKDMISQSEKLYAERPAYKIRLGKKDSYKTITYREFKEEVDALGTSLINMGLKGKRIAVISENRYEWGMAYLAITCGTGIVVPLDRALPENEIEALIVRAEVETIFYSEKYQEIMDKIKARENTVLKNYISMDLSENSVEVISQRMLINEGKDLIRKGDNRFLNAEIDSECMGMLLFTSGTTSISKAVELSHNNICANLMDTYSVLRVYETDTLLSFLPLHHTFECTAGFLYPLYAGASVAYCDGIRHIAENIKEYQITAMISVPILFENMYKKVMSSIEKKGKKAKVEKGIKISKFLLKFKIDIRKKLFKEIHDTLGGKVRLFISGAAALDPEVEQGFNDLGFRVAQGYGLTETSPIIAAGNDRYTQIGSVGMVFPSVEVKIDNPNEQGIGEIVVKGPSVMSGYYNNEEATNEVLKDGWFYSGDLGYLDKKGFLFITGRKKNVIVLKNGKNIYPEELETLINRSAYVSESFVYGKPDRDDDTMICAKIVYNKAIIEEEFDNRSEEEILELIWKEVKKINKTMPAYKYIRELIVTEEELIKTTTKKTKRHEELKKILGE